MVETDLNFYIFSRIKGTFRKCVDWIWFIYDSKHTPKKKLQVMFPTTSKNTMAKNYQDFKPTFSNISLA